MSRIGFPADDSCVDAVKEIAQMDNLIIEGAFTHFSRSDEPDGLCAGKQLNKYQDIVDRIEEAGIPIPTKHISNSPAILLRPEAQLDAVRAGDALFGLCPVDDELWEKEDFQQVLHWYTQVAHVKTVPAGTPVGYGGTFITQRTTTIATIPVGFVDGYSRGLSNKGVVKIRGAIAPVIGRVCMDQFMVDVTDIPDVSRGDTVTLLDDELSVLRMANLLGLNVDEIVCGISKRVPRVYE
jgi:alanine racemase